MALALVLFALTLGIAILVAFSAEDFGLPTQARRRARELFLSKLDETQRREWTRRHRFEVAVQSGRRYVISSYRAFNVTCGEDMFCVQINGRIPVYDKLLAQMLLLKTDEPLFRTLANIRRVKRLGNSAS